MPIDITCPCGMRSRGPDSLAGKQASCPQCGRVLTLPAAKPPAPAQLTPLPDLFSASLSGPDPLGTPMNYQPLGQAIQTRPAAKPQMQVTRSLPSSTSTRLSSDDSIPPAFWTALACGVGGAVVVGLVAVVAFTLMGRSSPPTDTIANAPAPAVQSHFQPSVTPTAPVAPVASIPSYTAPPAPGASPSTSGTSDSYASSTPYSTPDPLSSTSTAPSADTTTTGSSSSGSSSGATTNPPMAFGPVESSSSSSSGSSGSDSASPSQSDIAVANAVAAARAATSSGRTRRDPGDPTFEIKDGSITALAPAVGKWHGSGSDKLRGMQRFPDKLHVYGYSWMVELLPHLGHQRLYDNFDFTKTWADGRNVRNTVETIPAFLNPADDRIRWKGYPFGNMGATHFVGMSGVEDVRNVVAAELPRTDPRAGVFGYDEIAKGDDIKDGQSQTIMIIGSGNLHAPWVQGGGATIRGARAPYFDSITGFGSKGLGAPGAQVVMADGSVRAISANIDPQVFKAMCTIRGSDTVDLQAAPFMPHETK